MKNQVKVIVLVMSCVLLCSTFLYAAEKPEIPEIPQVSVRAVQEPYYVCSASSIGLAKGWFKEVGITFDPEPHGTIVTGVDTAQYIASRKADLVNQPSVQVLGAYKDLPPIKTFVYDSTFYGYVVLGQPEDYKSLEEFQAEGLSQEEALHKAMAQMKGKRVGYDGSAVSHTFLTAALAKGGLTLEDIDLSAFDDPEQISMMLTQQIDFNAGIGFPAAQEMMSKGSKLIASALHIVQSAKPSPDSPELRTAFPVGWSTYDDFIEKNYDLLLRFSSVVWRQARFINEQQEEAIDLHLPFINSISGSRNTREQLKSAYDIFDPFVTFEDQEKWFFDPTYPLYEEHSLGAYIMDWVEKGYLQPGEVKPSDISIAGKVYKDMLDLKTKSGPMISEARDAIEKAKNEANVSLEALDQASSLLDKASHFYDNYNYLDASRFAKAANEWAKYAVSQ